MTRGHGAVRLMISNIHRGGVLCFPYGMEEWNLPYKRPAQGLPQQCPICRSEANVHQEMMYTHVECCRCGDFQVERTAVDDTLPLAGAKRQALASFTIRKLQRGKRPILTSAFFDAFAERLLPSPKTTRPTRKLTSIRIIARQ